MLIDPIYTHQGQGLNLHRQNFRGHAKQALSRVDFIIYNYIRQIDNRLEKLVLVEG